MSPYKITATDVDFTNPWLSLITFALLAPS
jgi:hypothetical protein